MPARVGRLVVVPGERLRGAGTALVEARYSYDHINDKVRLTELFATDDATKGTLLREFLTHVVAEHDPVYIQADVSAHAPRMQATLEQLGFFPAGYCPAMVFEGVERLDVVRMVRLGVPWGPGPLEMVPETAAMRDLVQRAYEELNKGRIAADVARGVHLFQGLGDDEIARVRALCHQRDCHAGERLFAAGDPSRELYIVLSGCVEIQGADGRQSAEVGAGDVFGEMALLDGGPRSAAAVCPEATSLLVIEYGDFHHLMLEEAEIGRKVMHNLARTLSERLRDTDRRSALWRAGL